MSCGDRLPRALKISAQEQAQPKPANFVDLLITGGTVVTMDMDRRIIENGYVIVKGTLLLPSARGFHVCRKVRSSRNKPSTQKAL